MAKRTSKTTTKKTAKKKVTRSRTVTPKPNAADVAAAQALAVKYVPFDQIIGHERALDSIHAAATSGRFHHAWIFSGLSGVGKLTVAHAMAGLILDPTTAVGLNGRFAPDPESQTQHKLADGIHPDLHLIRKELARFSANANVRSAKQQVIPVDVVREFLLAPAKLRASHTGSTVASSVFLIDEAELMNSNAQNAMLKLLEEPAPGVVLVLLTSREDRLLPTIRSRCQRIAFSTLTDAQMHAWMDRVSNGVGSLDFGSLQPKELRALLDFADGRPGLATLAIETGLHTWIDTLGPPLSQIVSGNTPIGFGADVWSLVDAWAKAWEKSHLGSSKSAANTQAFVYVLQIIGDQLARHLSHHLADASERDRCLDAIELLDEAQRQVASNVQIPLAMDTWAAIAASRTPVVI